MAAVVETAKGLAVFRRGEENVRRTLPWQREGILDSMRSEGSFDTGEGDSASMSWFQSVAGESVVCSPSVRKKVGVDGPKADDLGVLKTAESVATVIKLGAYLGALSEEDVRHFQGLSAGSTEQRDQCEFLCSKVFKSLETELCKNDADVERILPERARDTYRDNRKWSDSGGLSLEVGMVGEFRTVFGFLSTTGMAYIDAPMADIEGEIGRLAWAVLEMLMNDSFKMTALEAMEYCTPMALEAERVPGLDGFEAVQNESCEVFGAFLKEKAPEVIEELEFYYEDDDAMDFGISVIRDIASGLYDKAERLRKISPDWEKLNRTEQRQILKERLRENKGSELGKFLLDVVELSGSQRTYDLLEHFRSHPLFEGMNNTYLVVDTGYEVTGLMDLLQDLYESVMGGEESEGLALIGEPEEVLKVLKHIHRSELLILAFCAFLSERSLSVDKAA